MIHTSKHTHKSPARLLSGIGTSYASARLFVSLDANRDDDNCDSKEVVP